MFVVCFGQGLGNQMFQYAFYLSIINNYSNSIVKMDIDNIISKDHNGFELHRVFGIEKNVCSKSKALSLTNLYNRKSFFGIILNSIYKFGTLLFGNKNSCIKQDNNCAYYNEVYNLCPLYSYIFVGSWINEKYFIKFKIDLLNSFKFKYQLDGKNLKYSEQINSCNSISIHVRRGDYKKYGFYILPKEYYEEAILYISKREKNNKFFVFTDEVEYAKKVLGFLPNYEIIEGNEGINSYKDMQLMSMCKHNIISNSTFSFWGAYLNLNNSKIVVAPNCLRPNYNEIIACDDWIILDILKYF